MLGVQKEGAGRQRELFGVVLGDSILMVRTHAAIRYRLICVVDGGAEILFGETSVVGVVSPNGDFVHRGQTFVCLLGCERLVLWC